MAVRALGRKEKVAAARVAFKKFVQILVIRDIEQVPVVESRAFELSVVDAEAERLHEM